MAPRLADPVLPPALVGAGIEPGDIRSLDDITRLPPYEKSDIMASVEAHPPLGDFHGIETAPRRGRPTVVLHTTSGTTGRPQPLLFGPRTREMQNLLLARAYLFQGLRDDDVVHSVYGHGLVNGGHYIRETVLHFTRGALLAGRHRRGDALAHPGRADARLRRHRHRRLHPTTCATWPTSRARWAWCPAATSGCG